MRCLRRFLIRLAASATGRRDDERLREELEDHIAFQTAENVRAGMSAAEARRQAVLDVGPVEAIKEDFRDEKRLPSLEHFPGAASRFPIPSTSTTAITRARSHTWRRTTRRRP